MVRWDIRQETNLEVCQQVWHTQYRGRDSKRDLPQLGGRRRQILESVLDHYTHALACQDVALSFWFRAAHTAMLPSVMIKWTKLLNL